MTDDILLTAINLLMPIAALIGFYFIYRASNHIGGELGSRFKILAIGSLFLLLYGFLTALMSQGIYIFSMKDGAWTVAHILIHFSYTVTILIGFISLYRFTKGDGG